jgi:hypothetical protein
MGMICYFLRPAAKVAGDPVETLEQKTKNNLKVFVDWFKKSARLIAPRETGTSRNRSWFLKLLGLQTQFCPDLQYELWLARN